MAESKSSVDIYRVAQEGIVPLFRISFTRLLGRIVRNK